MHLSKSQQGKGEATCGPVTCANTVSEASCKGLMPICPSGAIIHISMLLHGIISDKQLSNRSGVLDLLQSGDPVMAERGFNIRSPL